MTKTQAKELARKALLNAMGTAFYAIDDDMSLTTSEREEVAKAASEQMARIEKMFDYVPYSWGRG